MATEAPPELALPTRAAGGGGGLGAGGASGLLVCAAGMLDVAVGLMYFIYQLARMSPSVSYHCTWGGIIISVTGGVGIAACLRPHRILTKALLVLSAVSFVLIIIFFFFGFILDLRETDSEAHLAESMTVISILAALGFLASITMFTAASVTIFCPRHPKLKHIKLLTRAEKSRRLKHSSSTNSGSQLVPAALEMKEPPDPYSTIDNADVKPEYANDSHTIPLGRKENYMNARSNTSPGNKEDYVNVHSNSMKSVVKDNYMNVGSQQEEKEKYANSSSFSRSREGNLTYDDPVDVDIDGTHDHIEVHSRGIVSNRDTQLEAPGGDGGETPPNVQSNTRPAGGRADYDDAMSEAPPGGRKKNYPPGQSNTRSGERKDDYDDARSDATPMGVKEKYANVQSNTRPGVKEPYDDARSEASPVAGRKNYGKDNNGQSEMALYETYSQINTSINTS